jgi:UDP-2-acetamido-3-amino-2,3-dideoxy-glucuronate N-acetyltransferase
MLLVNKKYQVHPSSDVQTANIGKGTTIWQFSVVLADAKIGKNCNINALTLIGNNVTIKSSVQVWDGLRIEDSVFIGPNVTFTNDFSPRSKQRPKQFLETTIKEGASIGANSTIIGGITINKYAMIGAGSVITKDVGVQELWYGNPARHQEYVCECGQKLGEKLICNTCEVYRGGVNDYDDLMAA